MTRRELLGLTIRAVTNEQATPVNLSTDASLERWSPSLDDPWDRHAVKHFFHRVGIPASKSWIDAALASDPQELLDQLFDDALVTSDLPLPPKGSDAWLEVIPYDGNDPDRRILEQGTYKLAMMQMRYHFTALLTQRRMLLREKLTLF